MKRLACVSALALGALAGPASAEPILIQNTTVVDGQGKKTQGMSVLVDGGVVKAIGKKVKAPANTQVIPGEGRMVTPGLVDIHSRLGMSEIDQVESTVEGSFDASVHASYRAADGYNPDSMAIPVARSAGITAELAVPSGGLVAGQSSFFALDGRATAPLVDAAALHAALGERALKHSDGSRGRALEKLRELFDDARHYARNKGSFDRNQTRKYSASRLDLEALADVVQGRMRLWLRLDRRSDILAALRMARAERIRIAVVGGTEAWRVAKELAAARVPVIMDPTSNLPGSFDQIHVRDDAARLLHDAGVELAFSPLGSAWEARHLRQIAGIAVANGLPWEAAIAAITSAPARLAGARTGELKVGARADLVVWSGDPLEVQTRAETVIVGGAVQPLRSHQSELLQRYRHLKK
jgi:imidazolonepropionase-like amidohydrolase